MKSNIIKNILLVLSILFLILSIIGYICKSEYKKIEDGFYLKGKDIVEVEYGSTYKEEGFVALRNGKDVQNNVSVISNINEDVVGDYEVQYKLNLLVFEKNITRKVKIIDTESPKINIDSEDDIFVTVNTEMPTIKYSAIDNYDGDITSKVVVDSNVNMDKKGKYKITYSVKDSSGNETVSSINVYVQDKFQHTYIKISISKQTLEYYENNKVVLKTDVTTGKNNGTPVGNYKVIKKARNTYLMTKKYKSFVKYWIGFLGSSYGIHDASWRKKFGGKEYLTNGSHGCVNVPTDMAEKLYNMVSIGTPVYIKNN